MDNRHAAGDGADINEAPRVAPNHDDTTDIKTIHHADNPLVGTNVSDSLTTGADRASIASQA